MTYFTNLLTPRELQVAWLVHAGASFKHIGRTLGIATSTAKKHGTAAAQRIPGRGTPRIKLTRYVESCYGRNTIPVYKDTHDAAKEDRPVGG